MTLCRCLYASRWDVSRRIRLALLATVSKSVLSDKSHFFIVKNMCFEAGGLGLVTSITHPTKIKDKIIFSYNRSIESCIHALFRSTNCSNLLTIFPTDTFSPGPSSTLTHNRKNDPETPAKGNIPIFLQQFFCNKLYSLYMF